MPAPLVECIPNYSEARRPEVVEAIMAAIQSVKDVHILDRHSDLDHNRSVITMVGSPQDVSEAAFRSIQKAAELINLDVHSGAHPRIGATDVVPFVPISGVTMADCVELARTLGSRVGKELNIPVYLYEEAATRPERQNLENIRKGQYEALKEEIATHPERQPDFGPAKVGPAGATVIGARPPLVAFNIYLTTNDIGVAQKIARAVRNSSGGLRYVKAMGVLVDGRAQVSMNLTNYRHTSIARVVEFVRREAARYGEGIHHSELVGLIPQEAMVDAAVWYTQLDEFEPAQILESRLYEVMGEVDTNADLLPDFLEELAGPSATPGGGSAAAYTAAEGAALVTMVGRLTLGKKKYVEVEPQISAMVLKSEELRARLSRAVQEDSAAFDGIIQALSLPKDTLEQQAARAEALEKATQGAIQTPYETAKMALQVLDLALIAAKFGNLNAISDAASAGQFAAAGFRSAVYNVRINQKSLKQPEAAAAIVAELQKLAPLPDQINAQIADLLEKRAGLTA
jgi:glutamate formiminotransferase/formiminotetrahydrofolate cyclodeaminase